jgi:hypothetical protein
MDNDKVDAVLRETATRLTRLGHVALRHPADKPVPTPNEMAAGGGYTVFLDHALWMCGEVLSWPPEKLEKKFRWLGFIQGVLWMAGVQTIEVSKRDNAPEAP